MKFINYLESITGVGIYPLTSFIIFFLFFVGVSLYVFRANKTHISEMSQIPLDNNDK
jgi:hypothetical protein